MVFTSMAACITRDVLAHVLAQMDLLMALSRPGRQPWLASLNT
jgi:hypothetical protein